MASTPKDIFTDKEIRQWISNTQSNITLLCRAISICGHSSIKRTKERNCTINDLPFHHITLFRGNIIYRELYLIKKPELRNDHPIEKFMADYEKRKFSVALFSIVIVLTLGTNFLIEDPNLAFMPPLWSFLMPIGLKLHQRKMEKKKKALETK